jgi:hypothetical protein
MEKTLKQKIFKMISILILVFIFVFCIFYDLALATLDFPVLTSMLFFLFIMYRFLEPILR